jgi:uncharacterized protein
MAESDLTVSDTNSISHRVGGSAGWPAAVRLLDADLDSPFELHWNGGQAFSSQMFNALSMSFPIGEQYFIDSLRAGVQALPEQQRPQWTAALKEFIGQEAIHRNLHGKFNAGLQQHYLVNHWAARSERRLLRRQTMTALNHVAVTIAYEHVTAVLAAALLAHPHWLAGAPRRIQLLWQWHAAEELEHCAVAFELGQALQLSTARRLFWTAWVLLEFHRDLTLQILDNLRRSGTLWRWSTWRGAAGWLFGRRGVAAAVSVALLAALRPGYTPAKLAASTLAGKWLTSRVEQYRVIGGR